MDVGTVRHRVGVPEALRETCVERDIDDPLPADPVHQKQPLDEHGLLLDQLTNAERVDRVPGVGR